MNPSQSPSTEGIVESKSFTKKLLIINAIIFALYAIPALFSYRLPGENAYGVIAVGVFFIHSVLLLVIGVIDSIIIYSKKSRRNSYAFFASVGLVLLLGGLSYLIFWFFVIGNMK
jgi:uncharacterized membrane protein